MSFFCIGNESFDRRACTIIVSLYWALIYITIIDITASLYLAGSTSKQFRANNPFNSSESTTSYVPETDASGNPVYDSSGNQIYVQQIGTTTVTNTKTSQFDNKTKKYILKYIGIFNFILILTILLICIKMFMIAMP